MTLFLIILAVLLLLAIRAPVAVALMAPSLVYVAVADGIDLSIAVQRISSGVNLFPLLAIPLFVMAGYAAHAAGIADRLVAFAQNVLGGLRGSLGYVNIGTGLTFSWMSGSATADAAGMGSALVPTMRSRGYEAGFASGLTGAAATMGGVMPPSISAVIYATTAGVSIGGLFVAGMVPALLMALSLAVAVFLWTRKHSPDAVTRPPLPVLARQFAAVAPVFLAPVIVLGGILGGVFTPTEAAAVAVAYILLLGACYRTITVRVVTGVLTRTAHTTAQIMFVVAAASLFGWVLTREQLPGQIAEWMLQFTDNALVFLLLVNVLLLVIGMFIEPTAALLIMVPVILPVANELGVDPLHLGIIMVLNLTIGTLTPPVGLVTHILAAVTKLPYGLVARGVLRFLLPLIVVLLLVTLVPSLALWLPSAFGYT